MIFNQLSMGLSRVSLSLLFSALPCSVAWAQESLPIQNPLIRPPTLTSAPVAPVYSDGRGRGAPKSPKSSEMNEGSGMNGALESKAAARLTQDDLNVRQQALNASVVPSPLLQLFANMYVAAHARGAIVLRRQDVAPQYVQRAAGDSAASQGRSGSNGLQVTPLTGAASPGPNVLRFHDNQTMNILGYRLRARLDGLDVSVDWQGANGQWVNVFFGAVESAPGYSRVPPLESLQKIDKEAFKYLVPKLATQTGVVGGSPYSNNNQSGYNNGQIPPSNNGSNSFGTAAPIFPN